MTSTDANTSSSTISSSPFLHNIMDPNPNPILPAPTLLPTSTRLSLSFPARLLLTTVLTSTTGFALGTLTGGKKASLVFTAENSHRLPRSQAGWYLYHKSKNYEVMKGGIKEGFKMARHIGFWSMLLVAVEGGVDGARRRYTERWRSGTKTGIPEKWKEDWKSTVVASLAVSGAFSVWNGFSYGLAVRTAKRGLAFGLAYGLGQDLIRWLKEKSDEHQLHGNVS